MAIRFACACGKKLQAPDDFGGRRMKCPKCQTVLTIPPESTVEDHAPVPHAPVPHTPAPHAPVPRPGLPAAKTGTKPPSALDQPGAKPLGMGFDRPHHEPPLASPRERHFEEFNEEATIADMPSDEPAASAWSSKPQPEPIHPPSDHLTGGL